MTRPRKRFVELAPADRPAELVAVARATDRFEKARGELRDAMSAAYREGQSLRAIASACGIYSHEQVRRFVLDTPRRRAGETLKRKVRLAVVLERPIEELEISSRAYNCLKRGSRFGVASLPNEAPLVRIETIGDLANTMDWELMAIPGFGRKALEEVRKELAAHGLTLRSTTEGRAAR